MGVHNRDYMRADSGRSVWAPGRTTWWIIGINAVLWVIYSMAYHQGGDAGRFAYAAPSGGLYGFISDYLVLHPLEVFGSWRIWQPFTAFWLHDPRGISHLFWNMLLIYFFGRDVESWLGRRGYLRLYLGGGLASTLVLVLVAYIIDDGRAAVGASGCVYAVLVWSALQNPRRIVHLFYVLPVPMWLIVGVLLVGMEFYDLAGMGLHAGAAIGHLSGAAWGFVVFRFLPRFPSRRGGASGAGAWMVSLRRKRKQGREDVDQARSGAERERVDALLQKIHHEGISALTEDEKAFLQEASTRYR